MTGRVIGQSESDRRWGCELLPAVYGLTFDGDVNWLVCTQELRDQLGYRIPYQASMLCPNKAGALTKVIEGGGHRSFRRASALELLWRMVNHSEACWRTSREVFCDGDEDE